MKILVVDDNAESRRGLKQLIEINWKLPDVPLDVVCVGTMAEGLREAQDASVTILDLSLPDSSLDESIDKIVLFPPPVIVMTGYSDADITARCMANQAAHVFIKGSLIGFIPSFFRALQQDVVRRAESRYAQA